MSRHHAHLHAARWAATRRVIFRRDGWRCRKCGRAGRLECDHVTPLRDGGDPWDMANLQCLCRGCHIAKTRREGGRPRRLTPAEARWRALVAELLP